MEIDIHMVTFDGFTFIGSILFSPESNRLLKRPVRGLEGADVVLTDMINNPIPINGKLIRSKDNPKLFLQNLPNIYKNGYVQALNPNSTIKKSDVEEVITFMFDDVPAIQLPEGFEEQFPVIPDGVDMIELPTDLEKSIFDLFGHILTVVRGFFGRWVTLRGGRRIFIKIKNTFTSDVTTKDARAASLAFKNLPLAARRKIRRLEVRDRNIVEKILPEKTPPFLTRKKGYRVGSFDPLTSVLTIRPGRLRVMQSLTRAPTTLIGGKRIKRPVLDVGDLVNRGGGRALFPSLQTLKGKRQTGIVVNGRLFADATKRNGGVTRIAERTRLQMEQAYAFGGTPTQLAAVRHVTSQENFAELFMIYTRRKSKFRTDWARIQRTQPSTVSAFLNVLEELNAK